MYESRSVSAMVIGAVSLALIGAAWFYLIRKPDSASGRKAPARRTDPYSNYYRDMGQIADSLSTPKPAPTAPTAPTAGASLPGAPGAAPGQPQPMAPAPGAGPAPGTAPAPGMLPAAQPGIPGGQPGIPPAAAPASGYPGR